MTAPAREPYNELVRRYFANPVHAGPMPGEYNETAFGEAEESETGARIVLSAVADGETVRMLRYQVYGCPHLIAASEAFCESVEGQPVPSLAEFDLPGLLEKLAIPVEKTGRVFILEDAARALHISLTRMANTEE